MLTEEEYQAAKPVIESAQRLNHSLQRKLAQKGVQPIDILIAGLFAAFELAQALHGSPAGAVGWLRDAVDTIERQSGGIPMRRFN